MISWSVDAPTLVVMVDGEDVVGQFDGGSAGFVEFVDVVRLGHGELVAILFRKLGQLLVEQEHDVHPNAKIGRGEEALLFCQTALFDFLEMVLPGRGAHYDRLVHIKAAVDVGHHLVGLAEVDGDIGLLDEVEAFLPFLGIVDGNDDIMLAGEGGFLHLVTHLSVSDYCDFHGA